MTINRDNLLKDSINKLNIYEIAKKYNTDHKIIRAYLNRYNITINSLTYANNKKASYIIPNESELFTKNSIEAHISYLCEGWHTDKTNILCLFNQDIHIIEDFSNCLLNTYKYNKKISLEFVLNISCTQSQIIANEYQAYFGDKEQYKLIFISDKTRKNPIMRARCGGKNMARLFVDNAYKILSKINE